MKKLWLLILANLILGVAVQAGATVISYAPGDLSITVTPGETVHSVVNVSADRLSMPLLMRLNSKATDKLTAGWVKAGTVSLSPARRNLLVPIVINIPPTASAGVYSASLVPQLLSMSMGINTGQGIAINLVVNSCTKPPMLKDVVIGPQSSLMPNGKETNIWVNGVVEIAEGCTLQELVYNLDDEYGEYSSSGPVTVNESGSFEVAIQIEASRRGQDKDGRLYSGTLTATGQEAGSSKASFSVTVEHDRGKGKDK